MKLRIPLTILALLSGCFVAPEEHGLDAGPVFNGGGIGGDAGGGGGGGAGQGGGSGGGGGTAASELCVDLISYGQVCVTVMPVVCGGVHCGANEVCCQTTGACLAAGSSMCPSPPTMTPNNATSCGSNADCSSDEYCVPDELVLPSGRQPARCIGSSGHCQDKRSCGFCSAPGTDHCKVCGCDGVTYGSDQEACVAGVPAPHRGACGAPMNPNTGGGNGGTTWDAGARIPCGAPGQCPTGAQCCFRTGLCFDSSEPWRCELQPNGAIFDCTSQAECGGGLCLGEGCSGPGLCSRESLNCGGEIRAVCGCDGVTYVNECWARSAGVRIASTGACP